MTEIDFALSQTEDTDKIELVGTVIWNKANENESFKNLSEAERTFVYVDIFESEINNDGIYAFFYNTSGEFAHEVLDAYTSIGAHETARIFEKALKVFTELPVPKDIILRRNFVNELQLSDLEKWSNLELDLVNSNEDIVELMIAYIAQHKTDFEY